MTKLIINNEQLNGDPNLQDQLDASRALSDESLLDGGAYYTENEILVPSDVQVEELAKQNPVQLRSASVARETARLIRGGAKFQSRQLHVTDEQYDEAHSKYKEAQPDKIFGRLALYDPADIILSTDLETILSADENKLKIKSEIASVLEPYTAIFDLYIPPASSNKRTKFGNRLKVNSLDDYRVKIETTTRHPHLDARYGFSIHYEPGERTNTLTNVYSHISVADRSSRYSESIAMQFDYQEGKLARLGMGDDYLTSRSGGLYKTVIGTDSGLPGKLDEFLSLARDFGDVVVFDLQGDCPSVAFKRRLSDSGNDINYIFDPEKAVFVLRGDIDGKRWENGKQVTFMRPKYISSESFLAILREAMAVIPVKALEQ